MAEIKVQSRTLTKTYGSLFFDKSIGWVISDAQPHVCIKLKKIFESIPKGSITPFYLTDSPSMCYDILWFIDRYPLKVSDKDLSLLKKGKKQHIDKINELEQIMLPETIHHNNFELKEGYAARSYQIQAQQVLYLNKRLLLGDDTGLGKTLTGIISCLQPGMTPALVVCQAHLPGHWKREIDKYTNLNVHIIKQTKSYDLPPADIYIISYSKMIAWVDTLTKFIRFTIFDEVQELRRSESMKYTACKSIAKTSEYVLGLSATPIYNYGAEIYNVLDLINPGCLDYFTNFLREWCKTTQIVSDPDALGAYLRENFLMLRRTRKEVGRELPPVNTIIHNVEVNSSINSENKKEMENLANIILNGSFLERGQAGRMFDLKLRHSTGLAKARGVAAYVKILLQNKEPVLLAGWHRDVYDIWLEDLKEFNPLLYTGSESPAQKEKTRQDFIDGKSDLMIISLRSGVGLDGLQHRCSLVVIGELDWSPKVHEQLISRVDRDGNQYQTTAIFLVCEEGSDPPMIDILGLKASQSHGIINPGAQLATQESDDSRIKIMAEKYLQSLHHV